MIRYFMITLIALLLLGCQNNETANKDLEKAEKLIENTNLNINKLESTGELVDGVRKINLKAKQFKWEPNLIVVNKGEKIKITIESEDVNHGFEIHTYDMDEWDITTNIEKGESQIVEFTASKAGSFKFVCSIYCGSAHESMAGDFIVKE